MFRPVRYAIIVAGLASLLVAVLTLRNRFYGDLEATVRVTGPADRAVPARLQCRFDDSSTIERDVTLFPGDRDNTLYIGGVPFQSPRLLSVSVSLLGVPDTGSGVTIQSLHVHNPRRGRSWDRTLGATSAQVDQLEEHLTFRSAQFTFMHVVIGLLFGLGGAELITFCSRRGRTGLLRWLFIAEHRWSGWLGGGLVAAGSLLALYADWPGLLFVDTGKVMWHAHRPIITAWNGYVWESSLLGVLLICDHPAFAAIVQIFIMSSAVGALVVLCARTGGKVGTASGLIAAFIMGTLPSVTSSTISVFKDTPFAIASAGLSMLVWAWGMAHAQRVPSNAQEPSQRWFDRASLWGAALLFLVATLRLNSIVMLIGVPLILMVYRLAGFRRVVSMCLVSIAMVLAGNVLIGEGLFQASTHTNAGIQKMSVLLQPWSAFASDPRFITPDPAGDRSAVDKHIGWDRAKQLYDPRSSWRIWHEMSAPWPQIDDQHLHDLISRTARAGLNNPSTLIIDRTTMFIELLFRPHGAGPTLARDYGRHDWGWLDQNTLFHHYKLAQARERVDSHPLSTGRLTYRHGQPRSQLSPEGLMWMTAPALLAATLLFWAYKWLPATSAAAAAILFEIPFLMLTLPLPEFRYVYFVYLAAFFLVPLGIAECAFRRSRAPRRTT